MAGPLGPLARISYPAGAAATPCPSVLQMPVAPPASRAGGASPCQSPPLGNPAWQSRCVDGRFCDPQRTWPQWLGRGAGGGGAPRPQLLAADVGECRRLLLDRCCSSCRLGPRWCLARAAAGAQQQPFGRQRGLRDFLTAHPVAARHPTDAAQRTSKESRGRLGKCGRVAPVLAWATPAPKRVALPPLRGGPAGSLFLGTSTELD